jgi:hypothetical protein
LAERNSEMVGVVEGVEKILVEWMDTGAQLVYVSRTCLKILIEGGEILTLVDGGSHREQETASHRRSLV